MADKTSGRDIEELQKQVEELDNKLSYLLAEQGTKPSIIKKDFAIEKEIRIPKDVQLDPYEKAVMKEIYICGREGITAEEISKNIGIDKKDVAMLIKSAIAKGIPVQSTDEQNGVYRFEMAIMEMQARTDFLKFNLNKR